MKKSLFMILAALLFTLSGAQAQIFKFGVKAGVIVNSQKLKAGFADYSKTSPGFEIGIQAQVKIPVVGIFIQPEVVYSYFSSKYNTTLGDVKTTTNQVDIPVMLGWKVAFFRIMAGPVFSFPSTSFSSGKVNFSKYTTNYTAGVGFDLGRFTLDARYQGNFGARKAEIMNINIPTGVEITDGRFTFSLGYTLFKI